MTTVQGQPALEVQPGTDYPKTNPALVRVVLDGIDITLASHTYSPDELVSVANSLVEQSSGTPTPSDSPTPSSGTPAPSVAPS
jgi:hypothetical protein